MCPTYWPDGFGQLTPRGMHQLYTLGSKYLRPRYVEGDSPMLPANWTRSGLYVRSTDYQRTLQSVTALLQGLYPPGTGPTLWDAPSEPAVTPDRIQVIPIHTMPQTEDGLLTWSAPTCPTWNAKRNAYLNQQEEATGEQGIFKELMDKLAAATDFPGLNLNNLYKVLDGLLTDRFHGYPLPGNLTNEDVEQAVNASQWVMAQWYGTPEFRKLGGGYMVSLVRDRMFARANNSAQPEFEPNTYPSPTGEQLTGPRLAVYSSHDITLLTLLYALKLESGPAENPPYASSVVFELVELDSTPPTPHLRNGGPDLSKFYVRVFYNKGIGTEGSSGVNTSTPFDPQNIVAIPDCHNYGTNGDILCRLDDFMKLTQAVNEPNWEGPCGLLPSRPSGSEKAVNAAKLAGVGAGSAFAGLILGVAVAYFCTRPKKDAAAASGGPYNQL